MYKAYVRSHEVNIKWNKNIVIFIVTVIIIAAAIVFIIVVLIKEKV